MTGLSFMSLEYKERLCEGKERHQILERRNNASLRANVLPSFILENFFLLRYLEEYVGGRKNHP